MYHIRLEKLKIYDKDKVIVDIDFSVDHSLALVGQSGSGKSLTLKALLDLLPKGLKMKLKYDANFTFNKENIGFIPQNPFTALSPLTKIKKQFFSDQIDDLFKMVSLDLELKDKFPSQLSGGQLQRVVIAIALSKNPKMLLLDEPTTALDDSSKDIILELLKNLQKKLKFLMIFVSHDIDSVQNICKNIAIIKDGNIIEAGDIDDIINNPKDEYTKKLLLSNFKNRNFRV